MRISLLALTLLACVFTSCITAADDNKVNVKNLVELESRPVQQDNKPVWGKQDTEGLTPLNAMLRLGEAASAKDWEKASKYIDMRYLPSEVAAIGGGELIRRLAIVWSQQRIVDLSTLSDSEFGHQNDGLPDYRDLLGELDSAKGSVPVFLQRVPDGEGGKVWKISNATITAVPALWEEFGYPEQILAIADMLPEFSFMGLENWQIIGLLLITLAAALGAYVCTWLAAALLCRRTSSGPIIRRFLTRGFRYFLILKCMNYGVGTLGLSLKAKIWFGSGFLNYLALFFLLLASIELITAMYVRKNRANQIGVAIARPIATTLKIVTSLTILLLWLSDAGYNIATVLTGLGIGSLAVALAAQKTLENVFGAFTLYVARPIVPGDFCQFGDTLGTVEEIGLRSTRIRKLDRKVVHVPNSEFSSKNLVNFSEIDRRHYYKSLRISLNTSPDEIRRLLIALRKVVYKHSKILPESRRVRFEDVVDDAFIIVINVYISVQSIIEYKAIEEDLNLHLIQTLHDQGISLAIPQQHVVLTNATPNDPEASAAQAKAEMDAYRDESALPFPYFSDEDADAMKDTLAYPQPGCVDIKRVKRDDLS